jgi:succinyl-diaminopimelate desuccinylase
MPSAASQPWLDLDLDAIALTAAVCDIESVSGDEAALADAVHAALTDISGLEVVRDGNAVIARTQLGRPTRVVIAGHLDTVPLTRHTPNFAVLLEPTDSAVEGGCKGTLRVEVRTKGIAAHSARPWKGHNAIHDAAEILRRRLTAYQAQTVEVDGLEYHEALQRGRSSPAASPAMSSPTLHRHGQLPLRPGPLTGEQAEAHVREVFDGFDVTVTDNAGGLGPAWTARPPRPSSRLSASGHRPRQGWTDVARFSAMGVPAVNFGPGDPNLATWTTERCPVASSSTPRPRCCRWLA